MVQGDDLIFLSVEEANGRSVFFLVLYVSLGVGLQDLLLLVFTRRCAPSVTFYVPGLN